MEKVNVVVVVLIVALAISLGFNIYLTVRHNPNEEGVSFAFCWSPKEQYITGKVGILWMNFTFKTLGENLSITVKINDDDYNSSDGRDFLCFVFDRNRNRKIDYYSVREGDIPFVFDVRNYTNNQEWNRIAVGPKGMVMVASSGNFPKSWIPSPWHTCTYTEEGYIFDITLPQEMVGDTGILYAIYGDAGARKYIPEDLSSLDYVRMWREYGHVYVTFNYLED